MNWFTISMYARARKKGMTTSVKFVSNIEPTGTGHKNQVTRMLHEKDRTIRLTVDPVKEIA